MKALTARQKQFSPAHLDREAREKGLVTMQQIYGPLLPMVQFLQKKGWAVFMEGNEYRVGTKLGPAQIIIDIYEREKRREEEQLRALVVDPGRPKRTKKARRASRPPDAGPSNRRGSHKGSGKTPSR